MVSYLRPGRLWMLLGARRVGKTCLVRHFIEHSRESWFSGQGEDVTLMNLIESRSAERFQRTFEKFDGVFIDEAQVIPDVGLSLKLLVDTLPHLKVVVTGSSAFHLNQLSGQPLTGRRSISYLYPLSTTEIRDWRGPLAVSGGLEDLLLYGSYPEVLGIGDPKERRRYLRQLVDDYLFQDILSFERLRNARKLRDLIVLIAWQVGSEVSLNELGNALQIHKATVERYLDLLEKCFVIYRVGGFSRNLRKEVSKSARYYFWDTGIRNAVIDQFQPLHLRPDTGSLWENFVINERKKRIEYESLERKGYFWRTYDQQEIDWIEEGMGGELHAFECKWNPSARSKAPVAWKNHYPDATFQCITPRNFEDFV